jgi:quinol monooxygenase YgiN
MLVVIAHLQAKPGKSVQLIAACQPAIESAQAESGCISYTLTQQTASENDFIFVEEWQDVDALRQHMGTPAQGELGQALPDLVASAPIVRVHTIESSQDLADVARG